MIARDYVLPLANVRDELLLSVVFEAEEIIAAGDDGELVLDTFPRREVGGVLVTVFPDGAPRLEDGVWSCGADLGGGGEAVLEEAEGHEGVGGGVECVELR